MNTVKLKVGSGCQPSPWIYFHRKGIAPALYIIKIVFMVLMWEIMDGLIEHQNDPPFMGMLFHVLVIIPFLTLSNSVKNTFVVELDNTKKWERTMAGFAHRLEGMYLSLRNMRYLIFVFAIRSMMINGNLLHTFDYLI